MTTTRVEIVIDGIPATGNWGGGSLFVPIEKESDISAGFLEPISPKISNDPAVDVSVNLSTFPLIIDLSSGAWQKFADPNSHKYFQPLFTLGADSPLAWTSNPEAPIMPGCGWQAENGAYAFGQFFQFRNASTLALYGLDVKNNKVFKYTAGAYGSAGSWADTSATGTGTYTELNQNAKSGSTSNMLLGCSTGNAKTYDGSSWADFGFAAQHFAPAVNRLFYSAANKVSQQGNTKFGVFIGYSYTKINSLAYYQNMIYVGKPEGIFVLDPASQLSQLLIGFKNIDLNNALFLTVHGASLFFSAGEAFYEFDGHTIFNRNFAQFDGAATRAFYGGKVLNAYSDGRNLWLVFQVKTQDSPAYYNTFIVVKNGRTGGYSPIFVTSSTTNPAYIASGVWWENNLTHYSLGNDKTGQLLNDTVVPMAVDSTAPYTWGVGITTGWLECSRDWVAKWFKGIRITTKDLGTLATFALSYQKWNDSAMTAFPSEVSSQVDNTLVQPTAEGTPPNNIGGFVTSKVNTQIVLNNAGTASQKSKAAWVQSLHWVGLPVYSVAFQFTAQALLDFLNPEDRVDSARSYNAAAILDALKAGIAQYTAVKVTMPDTKTYVGTLLPAPQGDILSIINVDTAQPRIRKFSFQFREYV